MLFPTAYLCDRVFPAYLGQAMMERFREKGVTILTGDAPTAFEKRDGRFVTTTREGRTLESDILIVGVGIMPATQLAEDAGAGRSRTASSSTSTCRRRSRTSTPPATTPSSPIRRWGGACASSTGTTPSRRASGPDATWPAPHEPYTHMPYFFSDLFEFGYEAVGEVDSRLETYADWQKENDTGVIYYLEDGKVRGMMMCNVWDKVDAAREMIRRGESVSAESLRGALV